MQKAMGSPSKKMMKSQYLCIPRLRISNNSCTNKTKAAALSPMTLLERFREAVLRFIMLSAVANKTTNNHAGSKDHVQRYYCPNDSHHSEAVADCIEFIKKKASPDDHHNRGSSASASNSVDATADHEVVIRTGASYVTY